MSEGGIPAPAANPERRDDAMSLSELLALLVENGRVVAAWTIAGLVVAVAVVLILPAQWEARALIQIGQVGQVITRVDSASGEALQRLTEPPARAQERIKLQSFQDAVLVKMQLPLDDSEPSSRLYRDSLKVKLIPSTDLLEIKVRGHSREDAEIRARTTVEQLQEIHRNLEQPRIARLKAQLEETLRNLDSSETDLAKLLEAASAKKGTDATGRFAENVLLASLVRDKGAEIRKLREAKILVEEQLSPAYTYSTALLGNIAVSAGPVFPRKILVIPLVTLAGLIVGVLAALVRKGRRLAS